MAEQIEGEFNVEKYIENKQEELLRLAKSEDNLYLSEIYTTFLHDAIIDILKSNYERTLKKNLYDKFIAALKDIPHLAIDYNAGLRDDVDGDYLEESKVLEVISNILGASSGGGS